jgi:hypothetical protein
VPTHAGRHDAENEFLKRLKINTAHSPSRDAAAMQSDGAPFFTEPACVHGRPNAVFPGHTPGVSRRGARPVPAQLACFGTEFCVDGFQLSPAKHARPQWR